MFRRYFTLDGLPYTPSSGEASMVLLQKELGDDKDVYILDEPEKSLGNEYISRTPLLTAAPTPIRIAIAACITAAARCRGFLP